MPRRCAPMPVAFNGKFLAAPPTGVHRVADEMLRAVDQLLAEQGREPPADRYTVLCPCDILRPPPVTNLIWSTGGMLTWQFWEQFDLPRMARGQLLVNLCNLGPLATSYAITMIHDAQVFISPQSYSPAFRTYYRWMTRAIGRRHARILTVSEYSHRQLASYDVAPYDKITVIHNGADHVLRLTPDATVLARLGLTQRRFVVALANTQTHKNIGVLLRAFAEPALAALQLVLIGSAGPAAFAARGHKAPDNVLFAGRVSDAELRALLEAAVCLAFPSTTEGFGLPPLEAMMLGCPALVAPCGALPEVCGDATAYVDPHDPIAWSAAIAGIAADASKWQDLSTRGRAHAAQFTWRKAARALLDVIDEVGIEPVR